MANNSDLHSNLLIRNSILRLPPKASFRCNKVPRKPMLHHAVYISLKEPVKSIIIQQFGDLHQMLCSLFFIISPSQTLLTILCKALGGTLSIPVSTETWLQPCLYICNRLR